MAERQRDRARTSSQRRRQRRSRPTLDERLDAIADAVRAHTRAVIAIALVFAVVVMIYGPLRNYYVAMRSGQDLQAYLEALNQQNESLSEDIGRLHSEEGIEDEAHRRGWIKEGETGVVVEGLPKEDMTELLGEIELEDTRPWYIKVLDVVFFYSRDNWQ